MSRLLPAGGLVLSQSDARVLYQVASIGKLRTHYRMGDTSVYALLTEITRCAYTAADADGGNPPRQSAASEERDLWTVRQLATATGRSPRTVRLDCERGALPATKSGPQWVIQREEAETYVTAYR
ncbi:helix-turn-helix domain-containing protein [Chryseoglobus sp. 28M-23]|uniref:helix-turn-helix domain-containing protein n=1 Tax=Chryseoglobus sp. 28M-23 TaxID=2772253 RepID=UPI001746C43A|nr:helix-turn-helix domain-containing protein [Chryseoglobus sp. 28M-23]QOD93482.1 helix-turn-helix domain-containing protein [Chryseoglobus sp. 28M-23]